MYNGEFRAIKPFLPLNHGLTVKQEGIYIVGVNIPLVGTE